MFSYVYLNDYFRRKTKQRTSRYFVAANRWISGETIRTSAVWRMIGHIALRVWATSTGAWVNTFLIDTWFCIRTIAIHRTFRTAFNVRIAKVFGQTCTWTGIIFHLTNGVSTAWRRITWLDNFWFATNYKISWMFFFFVSEIGRLCGTR